MAPKNLRPLLLLLLLAAVLCAVSVSGAFRPVHAPPVAGPPVRRMLDPDLVAMFTSTDDALMNQRFDQLEAQAKLYREPGQTFAGGYPKLYFFYLALASFAGGICTCEDYQTHPKPLDVKKSALKAWLAASPNSIAGNIAMAKLLTLQAWAVRGHAYAPDTPDDKLDGFQKIMDQALVILLKLDPAQDAAVFGTLFATTRANANGRALSESLYGAAIKAFPAYTPYYASRADLLQPKWFGRPGELPAYLASLSHDDDGLIKYSFAAERLLATADASDLFTDAGLDWPILRHAFDVREQRYGTSNKFQNLKLRMALIAGDRPYAKQLAQTVKGDWDPTVWDHIESFVHAMFTLRFG